MRRLLILVFCLLLPLQGFAAWQVSASPCPMLGMMTMADDASEMAEFLAEAMEDCCNDMATFELTGQPCKGVQSCVAPAAGLLSFASLLTEMPVASDPPAPVWRSLPLGATSRLWRPPTSV